VGGSCGGEDQGHDEGSIKGLEAQGHRDYSLMVKADGPHPLGGGESKSRRTAFRLGYLA
jgi:hypothetical protein